MNKLLDKNKLIQNILYFLMVFSLVYVVGRVVYLEISLIRQIILALIITMVVKFFVKNGLLLFISLVLILISGFIINSYVTPIYPLFQRVFDFYNNISDHLFLNERISSENILPFWILMTSIYSLLSSIIIFRSREESFSLLIFYLPLFIYYWYIFVNEAYIALAIFLFAYFVLRGMQNYRKEVTKVEPSLRQGFSRLYSFWNKTTLVYGILIVLIALILPKSDSNIRWIWMEKQINSIIPKIEELRSSNTATRGNSQASRFNFTSTGFQEDPSRLGGPISPNNRTIMYVRGQGPVIYLRGAARNYYDGNMWDTISQESSVSSHLLETNFSMLDKSQREEYYDEKDVIVQFVDYASTTLFSPYMPAVVNADRGNQIFLSRDRIIELPEGVYDGETYGVKILQAKPYYELLNSGINNSYMDLANIDDYRQVPFDRLTQRTLDLKDQIVFGLDGSYEKAVAIESYLRENYQYTLNTSQVPVGHEFIDYFLFEERAGYCTYYATAMSIFLRLEGIPSRYVEGYIAHETTDNDVYEVKQSHAHAWVEAYIEPVGWMTFEPTSAYPLEDRELGLVEDVDEDTQEDDIEDTNEPDMDENLLADDDIGMNNDGEGTDSLEDDAMTFKNLLYIILGIIILVIPLRFLAKVIKYKYNEYRISKLRNDKKMLALYDKILDSIERLGHPKEIGETHYEYANRVGYKFRELKNITNVFVRNKYGNNMPSDEEIEIFINYRQELEEQIKNNLGKVKYYLRKY